MIVFYSIFYFIVCRIHLAYTDQVEEQIVHCMVK